MPIGVYKKTREHKRKISETLKGKPQPWNAGDKCHFWRGGVSKKIPTKCTDCGQINLVRGTYLKRLTHPYRCLSCALRRRIISPETGRKISLANRKYKLNESFFTKINNEEKAYWLGFLAGDGAITENKVRLRLAIKDRMHLKKFRKAVQWTGKDYYCKNTKSLEVYFRSFKMVDDLKRYYITPRKTFTVRFPRILKPLERHFIRGVFDADGCINIAKRVTRKKSGRIYIYYGGEFCIEGNKEFVSVIQEKLVKLGLPHTSIKYSGQNINRESKIWWH